MSLQNEIYKYNILIINNQIRRTQGEKPHRTALRGNRQIQVLKIKFFNIHEIKEIESSKNNHISG